MKKRKIKLFLIKTWHYIMYIMLKKTKRAAVQGVTWRSVGSGSGIAGEHGSSHGIRVQKGGWSSTQHQPLEARRVGRPCSC